MEVVEHMEPAAQALALNAEYQLARARLVREEEWAQETQRSINEEGIESVRAPKRLDKLFAAVRDGSVFAVVNERYDESLLRLAADYGLEGDDLIHSSYQRRTSADSHVVLGDTRRERLRHDAVGRVLPRLGHPQRRVIRRSCPLWAPLVAWPHLQPPTRLPPTPPCAS